MKPAKVSLAAELDGLADTLESAQLIAELLVTDGLPDDETVDRAPRMLEAVLTLAVGRVRLLRKVVIGADPALIEHRNNRALPHHEGDDPDVVLAPPPGKKKR